MTKYNKAGVHKFFKPTTAIYNKGILYKRSSSDNIVRVCH